jgi:transcriptional regulator with XRE-family HTH domain
MAARGERSSAAHRKDPDPLAERVGGKIRTLRIDAEFSFDAFVEETGLGRGYISELERGLVIPTLTTLARVAEALELTIADLVAADSVREQLYVATRELPEAEVKRLASSAIRTAKRVREERAREASSKRAQSEPRPGRSRAAARETKSPRPRTPRSRRSP